VYELFEQRRVCADADAAQTIEMAAASKSDFIRPSLRIFIKIGTGELFEPQSKKGKLGPEADPTPMNRSRASKSFGEEDYGKAEAA
jgi:hypothetical protein